MAIGDSATRPRHVSLHALFWNWFELWAGGKQSAANLVAPPWLASPASVRTASRFPKCQNGDCQPGDARSGSEPSPERLASQRKTGERTEEKHFRLRHDRRCINCSCSGALVGLPYLRSSVTWSRRLGTFLPTDAGHNRGVVTCKATKKKYYRRQSNGIACGNWKSGPWGRAGSERSELDRECLSRRPGRSRLLPKNDRSFR